MQTSDLFALAALSAIVYWLISFAKDATPPFNLNGIVTRVCALAAALVTVTLASHTTWPTDLPSAAGVSGLNWLAGLNEAGQVYVAFGLAALAGGGNDVLRSINRNDTSVLPTLLPDAAASDAAPPPTR